MIPHRCRVKHDPENGTYGDCLRACVASILDFADVFEVPHFLHDGCDDVTTTKRFRDFCKTLNLYPFLIGYPGDLSLHQILNMIAKNNPGINYLLAGSKHGGDHIVICKDNKIIHNPAWLDYNPGLDGPGLNGVWIVVVFVKI